MTGQKELNMTITSTAKKHLENILDDQKALRISLKTSGCAGFEYNYSIENCNGKQNDLIVKSNNRVIILLDPRIADHLNGSTLDYKIEKMKKHFAITTKNSTSECGCGKSFTL